MSLWTDQLAVFTEDFLQPISDRVYGYGWQNSGGVMPYADAMGVFLTLLAELREADQEGVVEGAPRSLQQRIAAQLSNINSYLQQINVGTNMVPQFTDEVDRLHLDLWQGGFRYKGNKVLGYEAKYRQISKLASEAERVIEVRGRIERLEEETRSIHNQANHLLAAIQTHKTNGDQQVSEISNVYQRSLQIDANIQTQVQTIDQRVAAATASATHAAESAQSAATHEKRIQLFVTQVETNENALNEAVVDSSSELREHRKLLAELRESTEIGLDSLFKLSSNNLTEFKGEKELEFSTLKQTHEEELTNLMKRMKEVEKDINTKLSLATGYTLFNRFGEREKEIDGKGWLIGAFVTLVAGAIGLFALLFGQTKFDIAFFTRLGFALPITIAVGFALSQYSKERRLKEEYAFKSALSLSLEAYRDLVEKALDKLAPGEPSKYAEFLVASITNIFESPTERVFGERRLRGATDSKIISATLKQVKEVAEIVRGK